MVTQNETGMTNSAAIESSSVTHAGHEIVRRFLGGLKRRQNISGYQSVMYARLLCYSKYKIYECNCELAFSNRFSASDSLMLLDGDQLLFESHIVDLLEYEDVHYTLGRANDVLIVERMGMPIGRFHRIEIEELR